MFTQSEVGIHVLETEHLKIKSLKNLREAKFVTEVWESFDKIYHVPIYVYVYVYVYTSIICIYIYIYIYIICKCITYLPNFP